MPGPRIAKIALQHFCLVLLAFAQFVVLARAQSNSDGDSCDKETNPDLRIGYCTRAIQSGRFNNTGLASLFNNRGNGYYDKGDHDRAIQDYDQAIRLNPNLALAFYNRGIAYGAKGDRDRAIRDEDQAIRLNPNYGDAFVNRGYDYYVKGEYDRAIQDLDQAVRLNPSDSNAVGNRGLARFAIGQFDGAAADISRDVELDHQDPYGPIWLYPVRARAGQDTQPALNAAKGLNLKGWPAPVFSLFQGAISGDAFLKAAADPDPQVQKNQLCEAHFYLGEYEILHGSRQSALVDIQAATDTCSPSHIELSAARAEVRRLAAAK